MQKRKELKVLAPKKLRFFGNAVKAFKDHMKWSEIKIKMTLEHKNERLKELISSLKKQSIDQNAGLWKTIALELERPTRQHRVVNLSKIENNVSDNDIIIVPGKVLSGGELSKKITIVAYAYSKSVMDKINNKASIMSIEEAMKKYPNGKNIKIIG